MTEAEKVDYRKRRIVKACDKCAKRKRKCHHNQPEMERLPTDSLKIAKSVTSPTSKKPPALPKIQEQADDSLLQDAMDFAGPFATDPQMQQVDDFSYMLDDPFPEMNFNDLLSSQPQWPWSDTADWTLMDPVSNGSGVPQKSRLEHDRDLVAQKFGVFDDLVNDIPAAPRSTRLEHDIDLSHNNSGLTFDPSMAQLSCGEDIGSANANTQSDNVMGNGMLWEHLRTGQPQIEKPQPTHTAHVHEAEGVESFVFDANNPWLNSTKDCEKNRRHDSGEGSTNIDAKAVVHDTHTRQQALDDSGRLQTTVDGEIHGQRAEETTLHDVTSDSFLTGKNELHVNKDNGVKMQPLKIRKTSLYTNAENVEGGLCNASSSQSTHSANGTLLQQRQVSATRDQENRTPSLGEGITRSISPSTELYMLKRRIPKSLHSVVDRNNSINESGSSSGPTPLLEEFLPLQTKTRQQHEREMVLSRNTICTEGNATQVNGGAYQRLDAASYNSPGLAALAANPSSATSMQTRPRNSTASASSGGDVDKLRFGDAPPTDHLQVVWEGRLSDHMRRRDHFGRPLASQKTWMEGTLASIAGLGCLLLFLAFLPAAQTTNLSLLCLALAAPVRGTKGMQNPRNSRLASYVWGTVVSWSVRTDGWLAGIGSAASRPDLGSMSRLLRGGKVFLEPVWKGSGKKNGPCVVGL